MHDMLSTLTLLALIGIACGNLDGLVDLENGPPGVQCEKTVLTFCTGGKVYIKKKVPTHKKKNFFQAITALSGKV